MRTQLLRTITTISSITLLLLALTLPVAAQENQTTTASPPASEPAPVNSTETKQTNQATRIAERKAQLKTKLTAAQQKRVQTRCKAAQGKITESVKKASVVQQNRLKVHESVVERLTAFEAKVAAQGVDTTSLKAQLATLQTKVTTFKTDLQIYSDAVNDTSVLDCTADPTAFAASLQASRTALATVRADAVAIRTHVNENVKPVMVQLKTQLAASQGAN